MSHNPSNVEADRRALQLRLRKVAGQLRGVETMIEGSYECGEVLNQLVSARKAIKSLAEKIMHEHLEHCLTKPASTDVGRRQLREIAQMLKRYVD